MAVEQTVQTESETGPEAAGEELILDGRPVSAGAPREVLRGRLWIGGSPVHWDVVRELGVEAVVDVDDADADRSERPSWLSELIVVSRPLVDGPDVTSMTAAAEPIGAVTASLLRAGLKVLVHCGWGRNRSGLVVSCALIDLLGLSGAEALRVVRRAQPRAVNNPGFAQWVLQAGAAEERRSA
jgi:hypothetical protein